MKWPITLLISSLCASITTSTAHVLDCCQRLSAVLPTNVFAPNNSIYNESLASYFAGEEGDLQPACIVRPQDTSQVSTAVGILTFYNLGTNNSCQFAIRSGGHTTWPGSANIAGGITLDMRNINQVTVNAEQNVTSVGAGANWDDVYSHLDPRNLSLAGGRSNVVGVGGLSLGGGISFFSPRMGFVCDNVVSYEIVLAGGIVREVGVDSTQYSDLAKALRGGSNNFGVVTRFDFATFPQGLLWGGDISYDINTAPQQLQAFVDFGANPDYDPYAALYAGFLFQNGFSVGISTPIYTRALANPSVFLPFISIHPQFSNNLRFDSLNNFTTIPFHKSIVGSRNAFLTVTIKNDLALLTTVVSMWQTNIATVAGVPGISYLLLNQHLLPIVMSKTVARGGNSLGLDPSEGPLVLVLLQIKWDNAEDDAVVMRAARSLITQIELAAQASGAYSPFKYLNYAYGDQDVIDGYGAVVKAQLQAASKKYDPFGTFQNALPGGFKLFCR